MDAESRSIKIHTEADFAAMRVAGRLAADTLDFITEHVVPGVVTGELDSKCAEFVADRGGVSAPLNYRGYPKSVCISVNHVVCHGIPGDKVLNDGDVVNIDVTPTVGGWHGDSSRMFYVGEVGVKAKRLIDVTYESLMRGIKVVKPGATTGDIGHAIQSYVSPFRYSIVRDFCGHGLGQVFHDAPNILHFGNPGEGVILREGMFFTIEPMVNIGGPDVKILKDGWTAVTKDHSLSAQFEHSIGVTADGYEIFTLSQTGRDKPPYS
ncbi:MAG: type I methionyl aminopeptidase [Rhodospirillales bacterium]